MKQQTTSLHELYAMSKLKLKSYESFFRFLFLLSGDIALNPGPTSNYPCSKCNKSVRAGIFCKTCNMWIHQKCEGLTNSELNTLSKIPLNELEFACMVCKQKLAALPFNGEQFLPVGNQCFQFQEEHLQNISLDDNCKVFKKKGLHFFHLNCNSLLSKIEELREFVLQTNPHVICFQKQNLIQPSMMKK